MSTKSTTTYGDNFHLYREALDDSFIYLELDNVEFQASSNSVTVAIPVHIWEHLRQYEAVDLSLVNKTDKEIREYVEGKVEERIERYQKNNSSLANIAGLLCFGSADLPKQEQIEKGVAYYTVWRDEQKKVKQAIEELRQTNNQK